MSSTACSLVVYWLPAKKVSSGLRFADRKVEFSERGGYAKLSGAEGGPFPGKLPKAPIIVTKATVTKAE